MATCGARYAALLRTSLGTTPDDVAWGSSGPDLVDSQAWGSLASALHDRVLAAWEGLAAVEALRTKDAVLPRWHELAPTVQAFVATWDALPSLWTSAPAQRVPKLVDFCLEAACLLERIDDARAKLGAPPTVDKPEPLSAMMAPPKSDTGGWLLGAALLGAVAYGIYRYERSAG